MRRDSAFTAVSSPTWVVRTRVYRLAEACLPQWGKPTMPFVAERVLLNIPLAVAGIHVSQVRHVLALLAQICGGGQAIVGDGGLAAK